MSICEIIWQMIFQKDKCAICSCKPFSKKKSSNSRVDQNLTTLASGKRASFLTLVDLRNLEGDCYQTNNFQRVTKQSLFIAHREIGMLFKIFDE